MKIVFFSTFLIRKKCSPDWTPPTNQCVTYTKKHFGSAKIFQFFLLGGLLGGLFFTFFEKTRSFSKRCFLTFSGGGSKMTIFHDFHTFCTILKKSYCYESANLRKSWTDRPIRHRYLSIHALQIYFIKLYRNPMVDTGKLKNIYKTFYKTFYKIYKNYKTIWNLSLTINLVFLSAPSVPILQEKTSTPITYLERSTHCVRGVNNNIL